MHLIDVTNNYSDLVQSQRWRNHDHIWLKIADQLRLFFRLPARHRDHRSAQTFGTIVRTQPTSKQAVTIGNMNFVFGRAPCRTQRTRYNIGPVINIVLRIADNCRFTCGSRRSMNAHHLFHWHGKGVKGIVVAQILFGGTGKFTQV